jgi:hypothetical protein
MHAQKKKEKDNQRKKGQEKETVNKEEGDF